MKQRESDTEKEAEKERGNEIKKFQKTILQTQNLGRTKKQRRHVVGTGEKEKSATIREIGRVPITGKVIVFFHFGFKSGN